MRWTIYCVDTFRCCSNAERISYLEHGGGKASKSSISPNVKMIFNIRIRLLYTIMSFRCQSLSVVYKFNHNVNFEVVTGEISRKRVYF